MSLYSLQGPRLNTPCMAQAEGKKRSVDKDGTKKSLAGEQG